MIDEDQPDREKHRQKILHECERALNKSLKRLREQFTLIEQKKQELSKKAESGNQEDIEQWNEFIVSYEQCIEEMGEKKSSMKQKAMELIQDETFRNTETGQTLTWMVNSMIFRDEKKNQGKTPKVGIRKRFRHTRV